MYPGDEAFLENVEIEVRQQIIRLQNHPSLVLWCGNNENSEGWARWGWQDNLKGSDRRSINKSYNRLFKKLLPKLVDEHSDLPYWESSPQFGRGDPKHQFEGDAHDWGVWHDAKPFETFREKVPRFMSEFGFQSYPSLKSLKSIGLDEQSKSDSPILKGHQKHSRGFSLIDEYMERWYGFVPEKLQDKIYLSQVLQAEGIGLGMLAHRSSQPYNMGTLYWQLNDCWPAVSWSSIDNTGTWKPLQYKAQDIYQPNCIQAFVQNDSINVFFLSEGLDTKSKSGSLFCQLISQNGNVLDKWAVNGIDINTPAQQIHFSSVNETLKGHDPRSTILLFKYTCIEGDYETTLLTALPKDFDFKPSGVSVELTNEDDNYEIELLSSSYQSGVLVSSNIGGRFSDNYFDLIPNVKRTIVFTPNGQNQTPEITVNSLNLVFGSQ
jgi:beta-mannosidase